MIITYSLALAAALCWAIASLISVDIARALGGIAFNRIRLIIVAIMLMSYASITNSWSSINSNLLVPIIISSLWVGGIWSMLMVTTILFNKIPSSYIAGAIANDMFAFMNLFGMFSSGFLLIYGFKIFNFESTLKPSR